MKNVKYLAIVFLAFTLWLSACYKDATGIADGQARLNVYLTDAPAAYDSVNISFSQVSAHIDSEWVSVSGDPVTVDLLSLTNGNTILLGSADIPAGHYTQVRVIIDSAEIGVDGNVWDLTVPSGAQTGLKMGPEFTVEEGSIYEMIIDFDASRSIVVMGGKNHPKGYKLKPHLRMIMKAVSGSVSGMVTNPQDAPVAYAIQATDTVTSAFVDTLSGHFKLGFLPVGEYKIAVADTNSLSYEQTGVWVIAGENNDLGEITLQ
ncbi:MAG: DUF4382 domain-containing protein [Calditrichales bacterium]|nr:MAG: DUF4382 domain-containing protein [Calditrichales bacterium]